MSDTVTRPLDSPNRCPVDGKKMVIEVPTVADGERYWRHTCWSCGHSYITRSETGA